MNFNQTISMAIGMFVGNFFVYGVIRGEWYQGFFIGTVSAILMVIFMAILNYFGIK